MFAHGAAKRARANPVDHAHFIASLGRGEVEREVELVEGFIDSKSAEVDLADTADSGRREGIAPLLSVDGCGRGCAVCAAQLIASQF